jgi:hypothetical protein
VVFIQLHNQKPFLFLKTNGPDHAQVGTRLPSPPPDYPSGAGKSTLLDVLAGRVKRNAANLTGVFRVLPPETQTDRADGRGN